MTDSIKNGGDEAVAGFIALTGGEEIPAHHKTGDASIGDPPIVVEIKEAGRGTANQVRADRYLVLVVRSNGDWFVIPPNKVIEMLQDRASQHGGSPFANTTISVRQMKTGKISGAILRYKVSAEDLKQAIVAAADEGNRHTNLKETVLKLTIDMQAFIEQQRAIIKQALILSV